MLMTDSIQYVEWDSQFSALPCVLVLNQSRGNVMVMRFNEAHRSEDELIF